MQHVVASKSRLALLLALGITLLGAALPGLAASPFVASWIWIG